MRIFLSWSGERSKYIAESFKEWLPNVLQYVDPYMSSKDIKLGERWSTNIEDSLREHDFGLVFVTPENINAPWINFEAGALTKNLKSRVIPIIFESDVSILNQGPLKQFQSQKQLDEDSIRDLVKNINSAESDTTRLSNDRVDRSFNMWWSELESMLKNVPKKSDKQEDKSEKDPDLADKASIMILKKLDDIQRSQNSNQMIKNVPLKEVKADYRESIERSSQLISNLNRVAGLELENSEELKRIQESLAMQLQRQDEIFNFVIRNI